MAQRKYASDWKMVGEDLYYSQELGLWWKDGRHYDKLSAEHNGIIGMGAALRRIVKETNGHAFR